MAPEAPASLGSFRDSVPASSRPLHPILVAAPVLAVFVLALLVRWWNLRAQNGSVYGDEAQLMIEARRFATGAYTNPFHPDMLGLPALYDFLLSLPLRVGGSTNVAVARAFSGLLGALGAPLVLLAANELGYRRRVGVVAAVALATTFWDVHFSRLALQNIMATTAAALTIYCLIAAVRRGSAALAACAGVGLAWAVNAYLSGSMIAVVVGCWLAALVLGSCMRRKGASYAVAAGAPAATARPLKGGRHARSTLPDLHAPDTILAPRAVLTVALPFTLVALVCLLPLIPWLLDPSSPLRLHMGERYILSAENRALFEQRHPDLHGSTPALLWFQVKAAVGMFTVQGDPDSIFNMPGRPLLDPLSGVLFVAGLLVAALHPRRPSSLLLLAWLIVPVMLGVVLTTGSNFYDDAPSFTRALPALPAMCLLIGVGLDAMLAGLAWALARLRFGMLGDWGVRVAAVALTAVLALAGVQRYVDYVHSDAYRQAYYSSAHEWGQLLGTRGRIHVTALGPDGWAGEYITLFAPLTTLCTGRWGDTWTACPPAQIVVFDRDEQDLVRYRQITHLAAHAGPPFDGGPTYWYVEGAQLPDPATVLHRQAPA